ncbi:pilus assembly protein PilP [Thermodesulfobacterium sp. TA1]|uniref:pilus assembly protein PilP n=1 Tax=Thermodesulfobacterium sp. TA1 TaxID=2234087 RepID=UPI0012320253|nr:pilus assembly protein PilP [Thermodesulfobacterium sp. TA1]QER42265.1 pilus assembly protein PilP [Thermodesulfobacterium sp. TA1]
MKFKFCLISLFFLVVFLMGCNNKKEDTSPKAVSFNATLIDKELETWKTELAKEAYVINPKEIKNPFVLPVVGKTISYEDVISIRLVGIVDKQGQRMALIQDEGRIGYLVKTGSKVGNYKVLKVEKNQVLVEEEIVDLYGNRKKVQRVLSLIKE